VAELREAKADDQGEERLCQWVEKASKVLPGRYAAAFPPILFQLSPRFALSDSRVETAIVVPFDDRRRRGEHRETGILLACGAPFRPGVYGEKSTLMDLAPTILSLLSIGIPDFMEGEVMRDLLNADFLTAHPPRRVPATLSAPGRFPSGEEEALRRRLSGLGYL